MLAHSRVMIDVAESSWIGDAHASAPSMECVCYILILILHSPHFGGDATPWLGADDDQQESF